LYNEPNKYSEEDLQAYCAPESLFDSDEAKKRFRVNLSFWLQSPHHLWSLDAGGKLFLDTPEARDGCSPNDVAHQMRCRLMEMEFENILELNENGRGYDEFGSSKAVRSLAYILTQDQHVIFKEEITKESIDRSLSNNFSSFTLNDSEKSLFIEYCNFLGITERVVMGGNIEKEFLDPTRLIESFLPNIFKIEKTMSASSLIKELSTRIPIIDNGRYNILVREYVGQGIATPNVLSVNLSHALKRLHESRVVDFVRRSDDVGTVTLVLPDGSKDLISEVTYTDGGI